MDRMILEVTDTAMATKTMTAIEKESNFFVDYDNADGIVTESSSLVEKKAKQETNEVIITRRRNSLAAVYFVW